MDIQIQEIARHRNGIGGWPFYVVRFRWTEQDSDGQNMVAILFDDEPSNCPRTAVLDIDMLAAGDIAFGSNSWRGDHFDAQLREACREYDERA